MDKPAKTLLLDSVLIWESLFGAPYGLTRGCLEKMKRIPGARMNLNQRKITFGDKTLVIFYYDRELRKEEIATYRIMPFDTFRKLGNFKWIKKYDTHIVTSVEGQP